MRGRPATRRLAWRRRPCTRHAWPGRTPAAGRPTKDGRVPNNSRCMVVRCLPREVANNVRKVAQFNCPIFQSNLFKSSPNAVVSLTGATASRLPSSCQSTHSLLAFVQRKTLRNLGVKFLDPLISLPIFDIACPIFFPAVRTQWSPYLGKISRTYP